MRGYIQLYTRWFGFDFDARWFEKATSATILSTIALAAMLASQGTVPIGPDPPLGLTYDPGTAPITPDQPLGLTYGLGTVPTAPAPAVILTYDPDSNILKGVEWNCNTERNINSTTTIEQTPNTNYHSTNGLNISCDCFKGRYQSYIEIRRSISKNILHASDAIKHIRIITPLLTYLMATY